MAVKSEDDLNVWLPTIHWVSYTSIVLMSCKESLLTLSIGGCVLYSGLVAVQFSGSRI